MANENRISLSQVNTALGLNFSLSLTFDQTTKRRQCDTASVGTSEETYAISADTGTPSYCRLYNKGSTNVRVGFSTGVYGIKVLPGHFALFELDSSSVTLYLIAVTSAADLDIEILSV